MPIILEEKQFDAWLDDSAIPTTMVNMLKPAGERVRECHPFSKRVNSSRADSDALANAIFAFSNMVEAIGGELEEAEINPLFVLPRGKGVVAADGVVIVRAGPSGPVERVSEEVVGPHRVAQVEC